MSNKYGVFVAPTGNDGAPGTMDAPVKTIAKAVELATSGSKFVVACDGTYDEQVTLTGSVTLYGGFKCPGAGVPWTYETGGKAKVAPIARGIALTIANASAAVDIEDFEFDAQDGVDAGESSIAAFVHDSTGVTLNRVKLVAGKGKDGANGVLTPITNFPSQAALNGNPAVGDVGGGAKVCSCAEGGMSKGGKGGDGGVNATGGGNGAPALSGGAAGLLGSVCAGPGTGGNGTDASAQPPAAGAIKVGTLSASGWTGADGTDGAPGTPGQGGGGGTGADTGGGGGGGGCGGCGGAGATAGKAGGSSIALLVLNTSVALNASTLVAGNAGKGGNGAAGQDAQALFGFGGVQNPAGCGGGNGGKGGAGGASGGAAGGISVGIVYQGTMAPSVDSSTMTTTGALGAKGLGGVPTTNDGIDGVKQDVFQAP